MFIRNLQCADIHIGKAAETRKRHSLCRLWLNRQNKFWFIVEGHCSKQAGLWIIWDLSIRYILGQWALFLLKRYIPLLPFFTMKSDWASYYNNFLTPKTLKMHKPILVTLLKLQPKHSQFCCNPKKNSSPLPHPLAPLVFTSLPRGSNFLEGVAWQERRGQLWQELLQSKIRS